MGLPEQVEYCKVENTRLLVLKEIFLKAQNLPKYYKLKIILETVITAFLLCILIVPMLFVALLIRLNMGSPIFFKQLRVGRFGVPFYIYKFRTMHLDSQGVTQLGYKPFSKIQNDPRVAGVLGYLLRKYKIDELPQFFNVLLGDMCLIGPRPYVLEETVLIPTKFSLRYLVRPGISGPWQVWFSNTLEAEEKFHAEEHYVQTLSFKQDCILFFKTIGCLVWGEKFKPKSAEEEQKVSRDNSSEAA